MATVDYFYVWLAATGVIAIVTAVYLFFEWQREKEERRRAEGMRRVLRGSRATRASYEMFTKAEEERQRERRARGRPRRPR